MIPRFHFITSRAGGMAHHEIATMACSGGAQVVQFREKEVQENAELVSMARAVQKVCRQFSCPLIVNDHVEVARAVQADGVHLGQEDESVAAAREALGPDVLIGGTANTWEQVEELVREDVDYIGLGPFRFTSTKEGLDPVLGLEGYQEMMERMREQGWDTPILAIGGLLPDDVPPLRKVGVHGIAVSGGVAKAEDPEQMAAAYAEELRSC